LQDSGVPLGVSRDLELEYFDDSLIHPLKGGLVSTEDLLKDPVKGLRDKLEIV
jgi:hypothetical protein